VPVKIAKKKSRMTKSRKLNSENKNREK